MISSAYLAKGSLRDTMFNAFPGNTRRFHFYLLHLIFHIIVSNFNHGKEMPYKCSFAISKSCLRESKAFQRFVSNAPKDWSLSTVSSHYSIISNNQCCLLKPFVKPHRNLKKKFFKKIDNCLLKFFKKILGIVGRILTGL